MICVRIPSEGPLLPMLVQHRIDCCSLHSHNLSLFRYAPTKVSRDSIGLMLGNVLTETETAHAPVSWIDQEHSAIA
jgi:hypothetical protein